MPDRIDPTDRLVRATTWLPMLVSALLVAIVAIFIFAAPSQVVTANDSGNLVASIPAHLDQTAMQIQ